MKIKPTPEQRVYWEQLRLIGCMAHREDCDEEDECGGKREIHHKRNGGVRDDHDSVICLCSAHHRGNKSIHITPDQFQLDHGTEDELIQRARELVDNEVF